MQKLSDVLFVIIFIIYNLNTVLCRRGRISNGTQASLGLFASQVQIRLKDGNLHKCGGTLIENSHVLTAAICVDGIRTAALTIMAGDVSLYETTVGSRQFRNVDMIIIHPSYNPAIDKWAYNIAVLKLRSAFRVNKYLEPAAMLTRDKPIKTYCFTPVWGSGSIKEEPPKLTHVLHYTGLQIVDILICGRCAEKTLCVISPSMEESACKLMFGFTRNRELAPVQLISIDNTDSTHCFTTGWGIGRIKGSSPKYSDKLYYAEIFIVDMTVCGHCSEKTICAMYAPMKEDPCVGDEGGGLYCNGYLRGVYAGSYNECSGTGAIYGDVMLLGPWIKRVLVWDGEGEIPLPLPEGRRL